MQNSDFAFWLVFQTKNMFVKCCFLLFFTVGAFPSRFPTWLFLTDFGGIFRLNTAETLKTGFAKSILKFRFSFYTYISFLLRDFCRTKNLKEKSNPDLAPPVLRLAAGWHLIWPPEIGQEKSRRVSLDLIWLFLTCVHKCLKTKSFSISCEDF